MARPALLWPSSAQPTGLTGPGFTGPMAQIKRATGTPQSSPYTIHNICVWIVSYGSVFKKRMASRLKFFTLSLLQILKHAYQM